MTVVFGMYKSPIGYGKVKAYYEHFRTGKGFGLEPIETRPCTFADFLLPAQENGERLLQTDEVLQPEDLSETVGDSETEAVLQPDDVSQTLNDQESNEEQETEAIND